MRCNRCGCTDYISYCYWNDDVFYSKYAFYRIVDNTIKILDFQDLLDTYDWFIDDNCLICSTCFNELVDNNELKLISDFDKCFFCLNPSSDTYVVHTRNEISYMSKHNRYCYYYYVIDSQYQEWYVSDWNLPESIIPNITLICQDCLDILVHFEYLTFSKQLPYSIPPRFINDNDWRFDPDDVIVYPDQYFDEKYTEYYQFLKTERLRRLVLADIKSMGKTSHE